MLQFWTTCPATTCLGGSLKPTTPTDRFGYAYPVSGEPGNSQDQLGGQFFDLFFWETARELDMPVSFAGLVELLVPTSQQAFFVES